MSYELVSEKEGAPFSWSLVIAQARRISDLQKPVPSPNVAISVSRDLLDDGLDMDSERDHAQWIRGSIKNSGDRGVEGCRLKLLKVDGPNLPERVTKVINGFLQWEGGFRESKRLNPGEYLIFDIATRRYDSKSHLCLWTVKHGPPINCYLRAPGIYTLTLDVYGTTFRQ
jgi:hypothetical protein